MLVYLMQPLADPLLILVLAGLGGLLYAISAGDRPRQVTRRQVEARRRAAERRIAQIGEDARAAIQAAAERRRRDGSVRDQQRR
jgi:hypothetical protein